MTPSVSVVIPTLNEQPFVRDCLDSLLAQDYPAVVEILVVDGGSTDRTRQIAERSRPLVRLLENPRGAPGPALDIGVRHARGEIVLRADCRAVYATDHVRRSVEVLVETGADNVGGHVQPVATTRFGRGVCAVTTSALAIGPEQFHVSSARQVVETFHLGCFWRSAVEAPSGRDGVTVVDPTIRATYFVRETPGALARQYFDYGVRRAAALAERGSVPTVRPLAPAALVLGSALALSGLRGWFGSALGVSHSAACCAATGYLSGKADANAWSVLLALEICHWCYGLGFWVGLGRARFRRRSWR